MPESLPAYAFPGAYPIVYPSWLGHLCADCATANDITPGSGFVHWEGEPIECEECDASIPSAYGDPTKTEN